MKAIEDFFDATGVPGLKGRIFTERDVRDFEKVIDRVVRQGAAPMPRGGRDAPETGRVSAEQYDKMSGADKYTYAHGHDQRSMPPWRDPRG